MCQKNTDVISNPKGRHCDEFVCFRHHSKTQVIHCRGVFKHIIYSSPSCTFWSNQVSVKAKRQAFFYLCTCSPWYIGSLQLISLWTWWSYTGKQAVGRPVHRVATSFYHPLQPLPNTPPSFSFCASSSDPFHCHGKSKCSSQEGNVWETSGIVTCVPKAEVKLMAI